MILFGFTLQTFSHSLSVRFIGACIREPTVLRYIEYKFCGSETSLLGPWSGVKVNAKTEYVLLKLFPSTFALQFYENINNDLLKSNI